MTKIQILGKIFLSNFSLMTPFSDQIEAEESRSVVYFDLRSSQNAKTGAKGLKNVKNSDFLTNFVNTIVT